MVSAIPEDAADGWVEIPAYFEPGGSELEGVLEGLRRLEVEPRLRMMDTRQRDLAEWLGAPGESAPRGCVVSVPGRRLQDVARLLAALLYPPEAPPETCEACGASLPADTPGTRCPSCGLDWSGSGEPDPLRDFLHAVLGSGS